MKIKAELSLREQLKKFESEVIQWNSEANVFVRNLILVRQEAKMHRLDATINIFRMIMLISKLKIVGPDLLNPVFASFCGVL